MKTLRTLFIALSAGIIFWSGSSLGQSPQIVDWEGNYYNIVEIGSQTWMQENLKATKYNDGTDIPIVTDGVTWISLMTPAYCWYDNDPATYKDTYGALYNWYTVETDMLCPEDWHVPSYDEWHVLFDYFGGYNLAGGKLKTTGTMEGGDGLWYAPNEGATNESGFNGLPSGYRSGIIDGTFGFINGITMFWSTTEYTTSPGNYHSPSLHYLLSNVSNNVSEKESGLSVRCVHDGGFEPKTTSVLLTDRVEDITHSSAECFADFTHHGNVTSVTKGICWSTTPNPTIDDVNDFFTDEGPGYSPFSSVMDGLLPNTTYFVRAYGVNDIGIAYGNEISFITSSSLATDSLALVDLYNSTDGDNWNRNENWLTGELDDWQGVGVSGGRVTTLLLNKNNLTGTIPPSIGDLSELVILDLWTNKLNGSIPSEIGNLGNLTRLYLNSNELTGPIPVEIGQLTNLDYLMLNGNQLSGSIPDDIAALSSLTILYLGNNLLTGGIPPVLGSMTSLVQLSLSFNPLGGTIPSELGDLENLEFLILKDNQLSGTIPPEIWGLSNLKQLHVGINNLEGTIPPEIGNLTNLMLLQLYSNQFSGELPSAIGNLETLFMFNIHSNDFAGPVPSEITNLTSLKFINIKDNLFSSLPVLTSLTNLDSLIIEDNMFTFGDIEPNIGVAPFFTYSPQANIETESDIAVHLGEEVVFTVNAGGTNSEYQWFKDGDELGTPSSDNTLTISSVSLSDVGDYGCYVTNSVAPDLILQADPASLDVIDAIVQVINTNDAGPGSLRSAINFANSNEGLDEIVFNISEPEPLTITLLTPLPAIDDPVIIDGYTQDGATPNSNLPFQGMNSVLKIELDGSNLVEADGQGFIINSGGCTVRGLVLNRFAHRGISLWLGGGNIIEGNYFGTDISGTTTEDLGIGTFAIEISGSDNNIIRNNIVSGNGGTDPNHPNPGIIVAPFEDPGYEISSGNKFFGNYIGTDVTGTIPLPNNGSGIDIGDSPDNIIGGLNPGDLNIIYGGIGIYGNANTTGNKVIGNYIGPNVSGDLPMGDPMMGLFIGGEASENEIGPLNVISGCGSGIVFGEGTSDNVVFGNLIGVNKDGSTALSNTSTNIVIENSSGNVIGGPDPEDRNVISGSGSNFGILITGSLSTANEVINNYIGTNAAGTVAIGNADNGVVIQDGASDNIIGGYNLISGNGFFGVSISGAETTGNQVINNLIGTNATGDALISNADDGVNIFDAPDNVISGNVLCGAGIGFGAPNNGVEILGPEASGNLVTGNYIGTNTNDTPGLGNGFMGVQIKRNAHHNTIGPNNVISGNLYDGILVETEGELIDEADYNIITGNLIGTTADGLDPLPNLGFGIKIKDNASNNTVGPDNVVSGNLEGGVYIQGPNAFGNTVFGNKIGVDINGDEPVPNGGGTECTIDNSPGNIIGGTGEGDGNILRFIDIRGLEAQNNQVMGNYLGIKADGNTPIVPDPVYMTSAVNITGASNNTIGPGNVISGNSIGINIQPMDEPSPEDGAGNRIVGNKIGTNADGTLAVPNTYIGINVPSVQGTIIGGLDEADRNIISGNTYGIVLAQPTGHTVVLGNYIGTDVTGTEPIGNSHGIWIGDQGNNNVIGGNTPEARNVISGNGNGISIVEGSFENAVIGNYIGLKENGTDPLGNQNFGIEIRDSYANLIGGPEAGQGNVISANGTHDLYNHGILICFADSEEGNTVQGNFIGTDFTGMLDKGNSGYGIMVYHASNNRILDNLVSANNHGIGIYEEDENDENFSGPEYDLVSEHNFVQGNRVGIKADGELLGNAGLGVFLARCKSNTIGGTLPEEGNIISGNNKGVALNEGADDNLIRGNEISYNISAGINLWRVKGNRVEGNLIAENENLPIYLNGNDNVIGGSEDEKRNIIYGPTGGIIIPIVSTGNRIENNYLGTDESGLNAMNSGEEPHDGIWLGGSDNIILNNLISGYKGEGIDIATAPDSDSIASNNLIEGNRIGLNAHETGYIPNRNGVYLFHAENNIIIRNKIAGNSANGILVLDNDPPLTFNNLISENSIYDNAGLGIELSTEGTQEGGTDGVTPNDEDVNDADQGPNGIQNYPVLNSVGFSPGYVTVSGYLKSTLGTPYNLEFFANMTADHFNYGEGETYIGSLAVQTDNDSGYVFFEEVLPVLGFPGQFITATATDPSGNTSEFSAAIGGIKAQTLSAMHQPFIYKINQEGVPSIRNGDDLAAIRNSFATWSEIPTADLDFEDGGTTTERYASATDGTNLVTFTDNKFPIPPGVLAISAKTLRVVPGEEVAEILDADIVFNPDFVDGAEYYFGISDGSSDSKIFDIESITTHEIGHAMGLIHTGIPLSTMFYALGTDILNRTLEADDLAWASYRYPGAGVDDSYGYISGQVTYGEIEIPGENPGEVSHPEVAGALVLALDKENFDYDQAHPENPVNTSKWFHTYTDANGNYKVPVEASAAGTEYYVHIQPLDGDVFGFDLRPGNISAYIYAHTIYTDYPDEMYNVGDGPEDTGDPSPVPVIAGETTSGIDLVTNLDTEPPYVEDATASPVDDNGKLILKPKFFIYFNEAVDLSSFEIASCYLEYEDGEATQTIGGQYVYFDENSGDIVVFAPDQLEFNKDYTLYVKNILDLEENEMIDDSTYTKSFTTTLEDVDNPTVNQVIPDGETPVFITDTILVFFSEGMDETSVKAGFTLSHPDNQDVEGAIYLNPTYDMLTFVPSSSLLEGEVEYTVTIDHTVKDFQGNQMGSEPEDNFISTFTTVATAAPMVMYLGPEDQELDVTVETPIVADFSEPIDRNTVSTETFSLTSADGVKVNGSFEFLLNDSRVVFRPDGSLEFSKQYLVDLKGGEFGIYDKSEVRLPVDPADPKRTATFTTAEVFTVPYIEYLDPVSGVDGALVKVSGSGFDPVADNNIVLFNGSEAVVTNATLHTLTTSVPNGAISGSVPVVVNGIESSNSKYFSIVPQSLDPCAEPIENTNTGSRARSAAIAPDAASAYVTNYLDNTITAIKILDEGQLVALEPPITVGMNPYGIDINSEGTRAYVTNYSSHTVSVIELDKLNPELSYRSKDISVGVNPYGVAVAPDKKVYVANYESKNVSVIDADPNSGGFDHVIANVNTGSRNRDIAISQDAALAVVTGDNGVNIIQFAESGIYADAIVTNASAGTSTREAAIRPDAGVAVVTTEDGDVLVIDIYPGSEYFGNVIANATTGSRARDITISQDAMFVYISTVNDDETMTDVVEVWKLSVGGIIGAAGGSSFTNIALEYHDAIPLEDSDGFEDGKDPYGLAIDPYGQRLYIVNTSLDDENPEGQLKVVRICCGPVAQEKVVGDLFSIIQNLVSSGVLSEGLANALTVKLDGALTALAKGKNKVAVNTLNALINHILSLMEDGVLTEEQALGMIEKVNAIIAEIEPQEKKSAFAFARPEEADLSDVSSLGPVYPNPFRHTTMINYEVANEDGTPVRVKMSVINSTGQVVAHLVDQVMSPGRYSVEWNGKYPDDQLVPDGVYYVRLIAGQIQLIEKAVVIR